MSTRSTSSLLAREPRGATDFLRNPGQGSEINGCVVIDSSDCIVDTSVLIGFDHTDHEVGIVVVVEGGGVVRGNCKCLSVNILGFSEFSYCSKFSITTHAILVVIIM